MKKLTPVKDNRPGYQRQAEEQITHRCECGAVVLHNSRREPQFQHIGPCNIDHVTQTEE